MTMLTVGDGIFLHSWRTECSAQDKKYVARRTEHLLSKIRAYRYEERMIDK